MDFKKFFIYFLLPTLTILLIPYLTKGERIDETRLIMAVSAGIFLGSVRFLWERYQDRKQEID